MNKRFGVTLGLMAIAAFVLVMPSLVNAHGIHITCSRLVTISGNIGRAATASPAVLHVRGTCRENVSFGVTRTNITLDGSGAGAGTMAQLTTNLVDPDNPELVGNTGSPGITVQGRGIRIVNMSIHAFTDSPGIRINQGGTARVGQIILTPDQTDILTIEGNDIFDNNAGVELNNNGFGTIVNNEIHDNAGSGVDVRGNSMAQIGFQSGSDSGLQTFANAAAGEAAAAGLVGLDGGVGGNDIFDNGVNGIRVRGMATASILSNNITNNSDRGIRVQEASSAFIANNEISGNTTQGIDVEGGSLIDLGGAGTFLTRANMSNNTDAGDLNGGFGVRCRSGGSITGNATNFGFDGTTDNKLNGTGGTLEFKSITTTAITDFTADNSRDNCSMRTKAAVQ